MMADVVCIPEHCVREDTVTEEAQSSHEQFVCRHDVNVDVSLEQIFCHEETLDTLGVARGDFFIRGTAAVSLRY